MKKSYSNPQGQYKRLTQIEEICFKLDQKPSIQTQILQKIDRKTFVQNVDILESSNNKFSQIMQISQKNPLFKLKYTLSLCIALLMVLIFLFRQGRSSIFQTNTSGTVQYQNPENFLFQSQTRQTSKHLQTVQQNMRQPSFTENNIKTNNNFKQRQIITSRQRKILKYQQIYQQIQQLKNKIFLKSLDSHANNNLNHPNSLQKKTKNDESVEKELILIKLNTATKVSDQKKQQKMAVSTNKLEESNHRQDMKNKKQEKISQKSQLQKSAASTANNQQNTPLTIQASAKIQKHAILETQKIKSAPLQNGQQSRKVLQSKIFNLKNQISNQKDIKEQNHQIDKQNKNNEENSIPQKETKVENAKVEPIKVENAKVEPIKVENAKVEPIKVENAKVEPIKVNQKDKKTLQEVNKIEVQKEVYKQNDKKSQTKINSQKDTKKSQKILNPINNKKATQISNKIQEQKQIKIHNDIQAHQANTIDKKASQTVILSQNLHNVKPNNQNKPQLSKQSISDKGNNAKEIEHKSAQGIKGAKNAQQVKLPEETKKTQSIVEKKSQFTSIEKSKQTYQKDTRLNKKQNTIQKSHENIQKTFQIKKDEKVVSGMNQKAHLGLRNDKQIKNSPAAKVIQKKYNKDASQKISTGTISAKSVPKKQEVVTKKPDQTKQFEKQKNISSSAKPKQLPIRSESDKKGQLIKENSDTKKIEQLNKNGPANNNKGTQKKYPVKKQEEKFKPASTEKQGQIDKKIQTKDKSIPAKQSGARKEDKSLDQKKIQSQVSASTVKSGQTASKPMLNKTEDKGAQSLHEELNK